MFKPTQWPGPSLPGSLHVFDFGAGFRFRRSAIARPDAARPDPAHISTLLVFILFSDHHLRPAMMLAGTNFEQVKALIDRGVAADHSFPKGHAYLIITPDKARSVRATYFEKTAKELNGVFPIEILETDAITDRHDVLFYFTGLAHVPQLHTLDFLPVRWLII